MYFSWIGDCGLVGAVKSLSPRIRSPQNTLGLPIQSNDHETIILRQADVQVLL